MADAVPADQLLEIDQWILVQAEELVRKCRDWYGEYVISFCVSGGLRFRSHRSQRRLFRHFERPAVHDCSAIARAAQRTNRHLPAASGSGAPAGAHADASPARKSGVIPPAPASSARAYIVEFFPEPEELSDGILPNNGSVWKTGMR